MSFVCVFGPIKLEGVISCNLDFIGEVEVWNLRRSLRIGDNGGTKGQGLRTDMMIFA